MDVERTEKKYSFIIYVFFTILLIPFLGWIFILNLRPQSNIAITNNGLVLLSIIVMLVLSFRFNDLQIPGLKLKRTIETLQKEAEEMRAVLLQIAMSSSKAIATSSQRISVNLGATKNIPLTPAPKEMQEDEPSTKQEG